jgi:peptide/nickel transport system permease protein
MLVQYGRWAARAAQGDLGRSIMLRRPVLPELWRRFQATLVLAAGALLLAFPLGVLLGVLSATRPGSRIDRVSQVVAMIGISMPAFWVGLLLIIGFSVRLGWLPGTGMYSPTGDGGARDLLTHLILPAVTLSLVPLAIVSRLTRSNMLDVIAQDYVRTARAKGASEPRVIGWHAFRNTLVALVTVLGLEVGYLLAGAVYVETVFSWPGIGFMMVNAILTRDFPLVQGGVLLIATTYVAINLATDLLYVCVDPRVRHA